jgi:hypothetical protein
MSAAELTRAPLALVGSGALAGVLGAMLLSLLVRVVPGARDLTRKGPRPRSSEAQPAPFTPEGALAQATGPGPEGSAALFAVKIASGLFGRDLRDHAALLGKAVHFCYGAFWGVVYALVASSYELDWRLAGSAHGFVIWAFGPAWLVPAMRLMLKPAELGAWRTLLLVVGHMAYGLAVAFAFDQLDRAGIP